MLQEKIAITNPLQRFDFGVANVAASADGTAVPRNANGNDYLMPFAGSIVCVTAELNAEVTAGSLTVIPTVSGVEKTPTVDLDTTNTQRHSESVAAETIRFAAGSYLGCNFDSGAGLLPDGTADLNASIYVVFEGVEF